MTNSSIPMTVSEHVCLPGKPVIDIPKVAALPGIIITVHGVNSTGEWFEAAETGCAKV